MQSITIVGAVILGACLASRLARASVGVTVLEKASSVGGVATARSFAWLNASWGNAEPYHHLRVASLSEWRRLSTEVEGIAPNWCGSVLWDLPEAELRRSIPIHQGWGYNVELVDAAFTARAEPALRAPPEVAIHAPDEGMIEPVEATEAFLRDAQACGASLHLGADVDHLVETDAKVTGVALSDGTVIASDHVVLAAGAGTGRLTQPLGLSLPLEAPPGLLVLTEPLDKLLNGLVISPLAHVRQRPDGRLIAGTDFAGADPGNDPDGVAQGIIDEIGKLIDAPSDIRMESYTVGYRPTPSDGVSIAGGIAPGLTVAVTHSGLTLAPILAKLLATEIMTGHRDPLIGPFGPDRFAQ